MKNAPYYISAYGLARKNGFCGTEKEWLASLKGEKGETGPVAKDVPYEFCEKIIIGFEPCKDEVFLDKKSYWLMQDGNNGYMESLLEGVNYVAGSKNALYITAKSGGVTWDSEKAATEFTDYYNKIYCTSGGWYCDGYPVDLEECGINAATIEGNVIEVYNIPIEKTYERKNSDVIIRSKTRNGKEYNFTEVTVIYNVFLSENFKGDVTTKFYSEGNMCGGAKVLGEPGKNYWHEVHIGKEHGYYRTGFSDLVNCDNIDFGAEGHIGCTGAQNVSPGLLFAYPAEKNITEIKLDGKIPDDSKIYIYGVRAVEE